MSKEEFVYRKLCLVEEALEKSKEFGRVGENLDGRSDPALSVAVHESIGLVEELLRQGKNRRTIIPAIVDKVNGTLAGTPPRFKKPRFKIG